MSFDPDYLPTLYARALAAFGHRVRNVPPDRWHAPTPDAEWDVRALVNHVTVEALWAPLLLEGCTVEEVGDRFDGDQLGESPEQAANDWDEACEAAFVAFDSDGALGRTVHLSYGETSAVHYCKQMIADLVVHAWDLSRGAGLPEGDGLDGELVAVAEEMAPAEPVPGLFGAPVDPGRDAGPVRRLVARYGRDPHATP